MKRFEQSNAANKNLDTIKIRILQEAARSRNSNDANKNPTELMTSTNLIFNNNFNVCQNYNNFNTVGFYVDILYLEFDVVRDCVVAKEKYHRLYKTQLCGECTGGH